MSERNKKFHTLALESSLFKGRRDWYFCYLKAEKIAHVLTLLARRGTSEGHSQLENLSRSSCELPSTLVHFAAGEVERALVLADIFSLLSALRLSATNNAISQDNGAILAQELEQIAERIASEDHPSPFVTREDFSVPLLQQEGEAVPLAPPKLTTQLLKDIYKGHLKGQNLYGTGKGHTARATAIVEFLRKEGKPLSIKDISRAIEGISAKTIQRELGALMDQGLVIKEGERRWSLYRLP